MKIRITRDFFVLPLLALATFAGCIALAESFARVVVQEDLVDTCWDKNSYKPNCVSRMQIAQGPAVTMRYNECGSRSDASCAPPPPGEFRIVTLGSSVSSGYGVPLEEMYSTVAARQLSARCNRSVGFQHVTMGWQGSSAHDVAQIALAPAEKALGLKPNLILVILTSWDLYKYAGTESAQVAAQTAAAPASSGGLRDSAIFQLGQSLMAYLREQREASRFVLMVRGLLYRNEDYFLNGYLANSEESGYMRAPLAPSWEQRLAMFETTMMAIQEKASAAGVPIAIAYSPADGQVLAGRRPARKDLDPTQLSRRFAEIATRHGWAFIDPLPRFIDASPQLQLFYRVNGHPSAAGDALLGASIADTVEATPALGCHS